MKEWFEAIKSNIRSSDRQIGWDLKEEYFKESIKNAKESKSSSPSKQYYGVLKTCLESEKLTK